MSIDLCSWLPVAILICSIFLASDAKIWLCFFPSATLMAASLWPKQYWKQLCQRTVRVQNKTELLTISKSIDCQMAQPGPNCYCNASLMSGFNKYRKGQIWIEITRRIAFIKWTVQQCSYGTITLNSLQSCIFMTWTWYVWRLHVRMR